VKGTPRGLQAKQQSTSRTSDGLRIPLLEPALKLVQRGRHKVGAR
jgi:hypothetical protein